MPYSLDPQFLVLIVSLALLAGFGAGALWMDATRTGQAKDRRAARRAPYVGKKAMKKPDVLVVNRDDVDWTRNAVENS